MAVMHGSNVFFCNGLARICRITGLMLLLFWMGRVRAGSLSLEYNFEAPHVTATDISRIRIKDCSSFHRAGEPELPFQTARILLPRGVKVESVRAETIEGEQLIALSAPVSFGRIPVSPGLPDNAAATGAGAGRPNPATYETDEPYPSTRAELLSVQRLHGCDIAIVRLFPVQYKPLSGTLVVAPRLQVTVGFSDAPVPMVMSGNRLTPARRARVQEFVDNPAALPEERGAPGIMPLGGERYYDYLLVTVTALTNAFQPLVEQKTAEGLAVKVTVMEEIKADWTGVDDAAKLRAYITHAYEAWGVDYVLLGGDVSKVPYRKAYARCVNEDTGMPCDLYFACLDGSWNSNGNNLWGEPDDGEDGGDVDLLAEVYVGRAPVDTAAETGRFVAHTLHYAQNAHPNRDNVLFMGEYLGEHDGRHPHGGNALDRILPSFGGFDQIWLDDRPYNDEIWTRSDGMAALNAAPHLVAHFGHANQTYVMRIGNSDAGALVNTDPFLVNSGGCYAGAFDYNDCIAEELLKRGNHGAFATIMNTRYGWFSTIEEWRFSGEFVDAFFDRLLMHESRSIGEAHFLSKQSLLGKVETSGDMVYRWCYFENTLFGDPHLALQKSGGMNDRPSLAQAIDQDNWNITSGGSRVWFGQTDESHDGVDAARSGDITHNEESWFEAVIQGPGKLSFWWKVSSQRNCDFLRFSIDGQQQQAISGSTVWQQYNCNIGAGRKVLRWRYTKDGILSSGSDCGWVDQVVWKPDQVLPGELSVYSLNYLDGRWEFLAGVSNVTDLAVEFRTNLTAGAGWEKIPVQMIKQVGEDRYLIRIPDLEQSGGFFRLGGQDGR